MLPFLLACTEPHNSEIPDVGGEDSGVDSGTPVVTVEHCGTITEDQTWKASRAHHVTCDVEVDGATLTIEPGTVVSFDEGSGLSVGTGNGTSGLLVDGATEGVIFTQAGAEDWDGVAIGSLAPAVSLAGLSIKHTVHGLSVAGVEVSLLGVAVDGVSDDCALTLDDGASLGGASTGLDLTGASSWAVCGEVATAETLPGPTGFTGNGQEGVYLTGSALDHAATWENLGVPYVIAENVDVEGTAEAPAVLTLTEGVSLLFERDRALRFSRSGGASALVVAGTDTEPVSFAGEGADTAGFWRGLQFSTGSAGARFAHATLRDAGGDGGTIAVEDAPLSLQNVSISLSADAGVELTGSAAFTEDSADLGVTTSAVPLRLPAAAVTTIPLSGLDLSGNEASVIEVQGDNALSSSATWPNLGMVYRIGDSIEVDGTAEAPAVLTLAAGVNLRFDDNTGCFIGKSGAAGLMASGTEAEPVTMLPWSANIAGAWSGVGVYDAAVDASVVLQHVEIGFGGGSTLKGNLSVSDASPTLDTVTLHDSLEWGLYLSGVSAPVLSSVTYTDNESGTCNACE